MPRTYVMGDPQAPFAKVREVLDRHGLLAGDRLAPDVRLISIGDHFDYDFRDPTTCAREGLALLRWLASHDPGQVTLLLGNHDAARVMELATITDETFAAARALAAVIAQAPHAGQRATEPADEPAEAREEARARARAEFEAAYPTLPAPGVIGRDYASFTTEQRDLVIELLLAGRFRLATTGVLADGRAALLTHAGVTTRELALLGEPTLCEPAAIAALLEARLSRAIDEVRDPWQRGERAPLSLAPLHLRGEDGAEGGGLLYHRPSDPARSAGDPRAAIGSARPRRFDPRTLPVGLTQVVGHTGHAKCTEELAAWATDAAVARKHGGIRTLRVTERALCYDLGVAAPAEGAADLILIDPELRRVPANDVALLPLARGA